MTNVWYDKYLTTQNNDLINSDKNKMTDYINKLSNNSYKKNFE